jgi:acyl carrier protein
VAELEKEFGMRFDLYTIENSFETVNTLAEVLREGAD